MSLGTGNPLNISELAKPTLANITLNWYSTIQVKPKFESEYFYFDTNCHKFDKLIPTREFQTECFLHSNKYPYKHNNLLYLNSGLWDLWNLCNINKQASIKLEISTKLYDNV